MLLIVQANVEGIIIKASIARLLTMIYEWADGLWTNENSIGESERAFVRNKKHFL